MNLKSPQKRHNSTLVYRQALRSADNKSSMISIKTKKSEIKTKILNG